MDVFHGIFFFLMEKIENSICFVYSGTDRKKEKKDQNGLQTNI